MIELRERTQETVSAYFRATRDAAVQRYLPMKAQTEAEALADFQRTLLPGADSWGRTVWADGRYVGDVWCYCIGGEPDAMLSFCIFDRAQWGRGTATTAVRDFLLQAAEQFALRTVGAFTFAENAASLAVLRKCGFQEIERFTEDGVESVYLEKQMNKGRS